MAVSIATGKRPELPRLTHEWVEQSGGWPEKVGCAVVGTDGYGYFAVCLHAEARGGFWYPKGPNLGDKHLDITERFGSKNKVLFHEADRGTIVLHNPEYAERLAQYLATETQT